MTSWPDPARSHWRHKNASVHRSSIRPRDANPLSALLRTPGFMANRRPELERLTSRLASTPLRISGDEREGKGLRSRWLVVLSCSLSKAGTRHALAESSLLKEILLQPSKLLVE